MFEEGVKYNGPIPQIKYLPTHMIEHSGDAGEVRHVSDEVAKNMDFSTPVQATAFRYGRDHDEFEPSVNISDGHHRLAAAKQTGRPHLPVEIIARNAKGEKLNAMKALSDEIEKKLAHKSDGGDVDGITAYHGSPHDFDEFDTSKIGTGEGAQAYGHGLYFAEHEPVAKKYKNDLSPTLKASDAIDPLHRRIGQMALTFSNNTPEGAIAWLDKYKNGAGHTAPAMTADAVAAVKQHFENGEFSPGGHMYEVHINAHPHHMLDWDKTLREQHEKIRRLAGWPAEHEAAHRAAEKVDNDNLHAALEGNGDYTPAKLPSRPHGALPLSATGADIYEHIKNKMGAIDWPIDADRETREQYRKSAAERASQYLLEHGIKGIKYLDAGSRGDKAEPTHNYVVFDHNDVRVKRKYEQGGAVDNDVIPHGDPKREQNLTKFNPLKDENGKPKVLYHGTVGNYDKFSNALRGSATGAKSAEMGHWFTDAPRVAQSYAHYAATDVPVRKLVEAAGKAGKRQDWDAHDKYMMEAEELDSHFRDPENEKRGQNIMPVHLSMKNPHVIDANGGDFNDLEGGLSKHISYAKRKGHDGLIIKNLDDAAGISHLPATHYMVFHPHQIKSATGNNGNFDPSNPDITKADGGEVDDHYIGEHYQDGGEVDPPKKKVKAYKLFRTDPKKPGKLFPLFVDANTPVPIKKWVEAKAGDPGKDPTKVKSKLGDLAYRPGWHAGDLPVATHIGGKSSSDLKAPDYRPDNHVWAEIEMPNDVDWQSEANSRVQYTKAGKPKPATAHITDQVPLGGHYRYKTNPNMTGNWLIGGSMKVNRILKDDEVKAINDANGVADLPRLPRAPETKARGGPIATSGPIVKRALELLSKNRTGR